MLLAPSILSADFSQLKNEVDKIREADLIHVDVMDGHFVPNISFGAAVMKSLCGKTNLPFDVHLMIENPDKYLEDFVTDQTQYICVHQETCPHLDRTLKHIKEQGVKAAVALNPSTPLTMIEEVLSQVDMVLIMSVNPGFGGQKFIESSVEKVRKLDDIRREKGYDFLIEVDGGVNLDNAPLLIDAGTDILVAGSAVFKANNIEETVKAFKKHTR
ncbi:MAG: ribulose-phosphate 3-epimerase [Clostridia bacterium]|nr:ribulose-phosphate 3-epimerase [Clostridia bacterium]